MCFSRLRMGFLKLKCDQNHMEGGLVITQIAGPSCRVFDPVDLGWGLRI